MGLASTRCWVLWPNKTKSLSDIRLLTMDDTNTEIHIKHTATTRSQVVLLHPSACRLTQQHRRLVAVTSRFTLQQHYRKRIVRNVITELENNQCMPKINLRESISELSKAWNCDVTDRTIHNSFAKVGFFVSYENAASTEEEDEIPSEELKKMWMQLRGEEEINDDVLIDDFLSLYSEVETLETPTELDILDSF
ncbi:hypothetical protein AVEN_171421-1 [Araneus ventricosus]|uniref:DDE-1 domain-containing protein n=1 Tax=Araneus ventricosus TaxID=182803 RepID=A0A4Y2D4M7_ARAVE|nr:hypothetical protein AVEN_171421-1 [Araneus ventricosus]